MPPVILEVKNLHTQFGKQVVHDNLDLSVNKGEVLGIVGGSGSGKSVLMRYMIGLDKPQRGKIIYKEGNMADKSHIGVLFQSGALLSSLTVAENVMAPLVEVSHLSKELAYDIALIKLSLVGLTPESSTKYPSQLSGGMIKRVALARALALDPQLVFLDEPTAGLDPIAASSFDQLVLKLQRQLKMTVVMVTHDLESLIEICDRVAVLVDHHVIVGTLKEVAGLDHPWIREYFHGPRGKRLFE
jgi:phospholipid/cholesterol/gamma-HCH transport system ATP-binding protein